MIALYINVATLNHMKRKKEEIPRKHTTITIPKPLYEKLEKRIKNTGFGSVSDYVTYVLREVISSLEETGKKEVFTKKEEDKVKQRLRALGYIE